MPKRKQPDQQEQPARDATEPADRTAAPAPTKRLASSFSIEALMRPSEPAVRVSSVAAATPTFVGQLGGHEQQHLLLSQAALLAAAAAAHHAQQHLQTGGSGASSSSSSSGAPESPISPGGGPGESAAGSPAPSSSSASYCIHRAASGSPLLVSPTSSSSSSAAGSPGVSEADERPNKATKSAECNSAPQKPPRHLSGENNKSGKTSSSAAGWTGSAANGASTGSGGQNNNNNNNNNGHKEPRERGASSNHLLRPQVCREPRLSPFECHLDNLELWHRFHPLDTEMIITKQGRRMFPPVRVNFSLKPELLQQHQQHLSGREKYQVLMDILPYDNKRYRYAYHKSSWQQAGKADPPSPAKLFLHPDGPFTLDQLKRQVISFEKIKLTNNDANKHGYIVLNSMHKYQPRIHLVLWRGKEAQSLANSPIGSLDQETVKTFIFNETIFTAVTAYQNHSITKLKIDSNPFAKGFRDSSRLTDYDLDSIQDFMPDGQCPYSPPRGLGPGPPGFPHFLLAAGAPLNTLVSPLASSDSLLRDRTIMALDSFLQQQQQQHHHHQHNNHLQQGSTPTSGGLIGGSQQTGGGCSPSCVSASDRATPTHLAKHPAAGPPPPLGFAPNLATSSTVATSTCNTTSAVTPTSSASQHQQQLEQLIMQHHHQQLAAVAAAMALGGRAPPPYSPGYPMHPQQHQQHHHHHHHQSTEPISESASSPKLPNMTPPPKGHPTLAHFNAANSTYLHPAAAANLMTQHQQHQQQQLHHHHKQMAALAAGGSTNNAAHQMELKRPGHKR